MAEVRTQRAYPRSRGATCAQVGFTVMEMGLSPLARGNPTKIFNNDWNSGPIPARAGQPGRQEPRDLVGGAYPRSRGATTFTRPLTHDYPGLSPLARGNPVVVAAVGGGVGPIPARAGQPQKRGGRHLCGRAYPRSRGATCRRSRPVFSSGGLSPLARGNREYPQHWVFLAGPIPARAGQPLGNSWAVPNVAAYPRSRGATPFSVKSLFTVTGLSPLARGNP